MRPDTEVFLHVLGGTVLFGAVGTAALLSWRGRRGDGAQVLAGAAFRTLLVLGLPAWLVLFVFGNATKSKEHLPAGTEWLRIGIAIAIAGAVVLLAAIGSSYAWSRTPSRRGLATATGALTTALLVALGVAWWVMTAKVPS
jgi:hypothetical protein